MKYKLSLSAPLETILPYNWTPGVDRLDWQSPYTKMRQMLETFIENGDLDRYVGPYDSYTQDEYDAYAVTVFNTLEAAETFRDAILTNGALGFEFDPIEEIPEY
jgi:hypothetical protein